MKDVLIEDIQTADEILVIMAFVKRAGVTILSDAFRTARSNGVSIRLITSLYMDGHDASALDALSQLGVEICMDMSKQSSNLHAKGWLFKRVNGHSTAIVGSSNISTSALCSGNEWNLRITELESPHLILEFERQFETLWRSGEFTRYVSSVHRPILESKLTKPDVEIIEVYEPIHANRHQDEALKAIRSHRAKGRRRNLIVAATGTGKTAIAAIDYALRAKELGSNPKLLFVAHRQELLTQALKTFRRALQDPTFGTLWTGTSEPENKDQVFVTIQTLSRRMRGGQIDLNLYDHIVIDEFHHAEAKTYRSVIEGLSSQELVGLTATPERGDGVHVQDEFFDGVITFELRLIDALDRRLVVPFHYYGVVDGTDLRSLAWSRDGYALDDLERIYTADDIRLKNVFRAMDSYIDSPNCMKCLGFCVTIAHANFMVARFNEKGIPSRVLTGESSDEEREQTIRDLSEGRIKAIFTVDLFNEGVDIPSVNTLLLLRPTKSQSLFMQQLGRGLRIDESSGKSYCVVLDFIGLHRTEFLLETPVIRTGLAQPSSDTDSPRIVHPFLPSNCTVHFERKIEEEILRLTTQKPKPFVLFTPDGAPVRIKELASSRESLKRIYASELDGKSLTIAQANIAPKSGDLHANANHKLVKAAQDLEGFSKSRLPLMQISRLLHIDDSIRLEALRNLANQRADKNHPRINRMIVAELLGTTRVKEIPYSSLDGFIEEIQNNDTFRMELGDVAVILSKDAIRADKHNSVRELLCCHATYTRMEVMIACSNPSKDRVRESREGVHYVDKSNLDIFFVTTEKDGTNFSDTTRYRDYAVSKDIFVWDSQNSTRSETPVGKRYVSNSSEKILFVRKYGKLGGITQPFQFLGLVDYVSHEGGSPMSITWQLRNSMTDAMLEDFSKPRHLEFAVRSSG